MIDSSPDMPSADAQVFEGAIVHPDLYLWDSWSYQEHGTIHLFCLAISRTKPNGEALLPAEKDNYPFHIRHFSSLDQGRQWKDEGCFQQPGKTSDGHDERNVWSGSVCLLPSGEKLAGFTGIFEIDDQRRYLQNISLGTSSSSQIDSLLPSPLSCPIRDREAILSLGYYLDAANRLGSNDGEEGGPVMAWRDPFLFIDSDQRINAFWSAKSGPGVGVIAQGLIAKGDDKCGYSLEKLYPPMSLPDGESFTQAELPKIYFDDAQGIYYLIVSSCNRFYEGQPDSEVDKTIRLYKANSMRGPWQIAVGNNSAIKGAEGLFGMTVLEPDFANDRLLCISPRTGSDNPDAAFTIGERFYLDLNTATVIR